MSIELVGLAAPDGARDLPVPRAAAPGPGHRAPAAAVALDYLRLVGPAVLAALGGRRHDGHRSTKPGRPPSISGSSGLAVASAPALTAWRRNLLIGLVGAVVLVAVARAVGIAALPV